MGGSIAGPVTAAPQAQTATPVRAPTRELKPQPLGNQALLRKLQAKLTIGAVDDPLEHEADAVAEQVMRTADPGLTFSPAAPRISRKCAGCEAEEQVQAKCDSCEGEETLQAKREDSHDTRDEAPSTVSEALREPGRPLDAPTRQFFEPRFAADFSSVRVHTGLAADKSAKSVGALGYTVGQDVVFANNRFSPGTHEGRKLLAHELAHVVQQGGGDEAVQRKCSHDGTPVNCHNWGLGMFPWLAGTIAHGQINVWSGIPPHSIPRATKAFMGMPSNPTIPLGFADLWSNAATVQIGEIKSTAVGSTVAGAQAAHYILRHNESMGRGPTAPDDAAYQASIGAVTKPGAPLDLSGRTGSGLALGPFAGDPGKQLWAEADPLGAVVYWCTGAGLPSPAWLVAFKAAMDALKKQLQALKQQMQDLVDAVVSAGKAVAKWITDVISDIVNWGAAHSRALALAALILILLVAIILLIISILAEAPSGGTSTAVVIPSAVALAASAAGILALIGLNSSGLKDATQAVAQATHPAEADASVGVNDFDPPTDTAAPQSLAAVTPSAGALDPGAQMTAALQALMDPTSVAGAALKAFDGGANDAAALATARDGIAALRAAGASADADAAEAQMQKTGLA
jgi:hypothetical protein